MSSYTSVRSSAELGERQLSSQCESRLLKQQTKSERVKLLIIYRDDISKSLKLKEWQSVFPQGKTLLGWLVDQHGCGDISLLRAPWTNGSGSFMGSGVLNSGVRAKQRNKVRSGKKLGNESEWGKLSSGFSHPKMKSWQRKLERLWPKALDKETKK